MENENKQANSFWAAFSALQADLKDVEKSHENAAFKNGNKVSKYANLEDVLSESRPMWTKHGFSIVQNCCTVTHEQFISVAITTEIYHKDGHSVSYSGLEIPISKRDAHGIASGVTYARRISLMSILGITGSDDDDGNGAVGFGQGLTSKPLPEKSGEIGEKFMSYKFEKPEIDIFKKAGLLTQTMMVTEREKHPDNRAMVTAMLAKVAQ